MTTAMRAQLGNVGTNAVNDARWQIITSASALDGCRIDRVADAGVEIIEADPANRAFPDRVNESLGICLKLGPEHDLWAKGSALRYPRNAVCVRTPGSVWSVRATGPVEYVSVDIDREHLPPGGLRGGVRFTEARALPDIRRAVALLRSSASLLRRQTVVTGLVNALLQAGLVSTPDLGLGMERRAVDRARELLSARWPLHRRSRNWPTRSGRTASCCSGSSGVVSAFLPTRTSFASGWNGHGRSWRASQKSPTWPSSSASRTRAISAASSSEWWESLPGDYRRRVLPLG